MTVQTSTMRKSKPAGMKAETAQRPQRPSEILREQKTNTETTERNQTMPEQSKNPMSEMLDQGLKNYEQALRTGLKLQEEAGKCMTKLLNQAASPQDLQKQMASMVNDVIPATQKSMEGYLGLLEQNTRASVELVKKGLEAAQTTTYADAQNKVTDFCESTLNALKSNSQAIFDINAKAIDSWVSFVKKATAENHEAKAHAA